MTDRPFSPWWGATTGNKPSGTNPPAPGSALQAVTPSIEDLWREAESFGWVGIFSSDKRPRERSYRCTIVFATIEGTSLEVNSDHWLTLREALSQAIGKARLIRTQFRRVGGV